MFDNANFLYRATLGSTCRTLNVCLHFCSLTNGLHRSSRQPRIWIKLAPRPLLSSATCPELTTSAHRNTKCFSQSEQPWQLVRFAGSSAAVESNFVKRFGLRHHPGQALFGWMPNTGGGRTTSFYSSDSSSANTTVSFTVLTYWTESPSLRQ